jgi:hypothetical protein
LTKLGRTLVAIAVLLLIGAACTCYLGVRHDVAQIPPEVRAQMADTDWVGVRWLFLGMKIFMAGTAVLLVGGSVLLYGRFHRGGGGTRIDAAAGLAPRP